MMEEAMAGRGAEGAPAVQSLGLTKRKVPAEQRVHCAGCKLRGGCVPWRIAAGGGGAIEVLLIEGINSPGKWSFPAGSLDPGEEVSVCAARETEEESGVLGVLGCFLGMFQSEVKAKSGSRSYFFALHVHTVINEGSDRWKDPDSAWESDGWRNRGWFTPADARSKLKKGQEAVLDTMLRCNMTPAAGVAIACHSCLGVPIPLRQQRAQTRARAHTTYTRAAYIMGLTDWMDGWMDGWVCVDCSVPLERRADVRWRPATLAAIGQGSPPHSLSALHVLLIGKPSHDAGVYSAERLEQALAMNEVHSVHTAMHTLVRARSKHERKGWACVCACACMRVCVEGL